MAQQTSYEDKFNFTQTENMRFARANLTKLVYTAAHFEGIQTTLTQTQTIMDGVSVAGVAVADIVIIVNLKHGWHYITSLNKPLTLQTEQVVNQFITATTSLVAGKIRSGVGVVNLINGAIFNPPIVNKQQEQAFLQKVLADSTKTTTDKALTMLYHNMRQQIFVDGNKRTALLIANQLMIAGGAGLINVPLDKWDQWQQLIADYYRTNDMLKVKQWTYDHGIQGVAVRRVH